MKIQVEKELLLAVFDSVISFVEINRLSQQKNEAVRRQDYGAAESIHAQEIAVAKAMPTLEAMKELRNKIYAQQDTPTLISL